LKLMSLGIAEIRNQYKSELINITRREP